MRRRRRRRELDGDKVVCSPTHTQKAVEAQRKISPISNQNNKNNSSKAQVTLMMLSVCWYDMGNNSKGRYNTQIFIYQKCHGDPSLAFFSLKLQNHTHTPLLTVGV
jgi:hypothetical protein